MWPHVTAKKNGWTDESVKKGGRVAIKYKHSQRICWYGSMDQDVVPWSFQISRGISCMILLAQQHWSPFGSAARSSNKTSDHKPRRGKQLLGNIRTCPFYLGRISVGGYTFIHLRRFAVLTHRVIWPLPYPEFPVGLFNRPRLFLVTDLVPLLFSFHIHFLSHLYPSFTQAWKRNTKPVLHPTASIMIRNTIPAMLLRSSSKNQSRKRNLTSWNAHLRLGIYR